MVLGWTKEATVVYKTSSRNQLYSDEKRHTFCTVNTSWRKVRPSWYERQTYSEIQDQERLQCACASHHVAEHVFKTTSMLSGVQVFIFILSVLRRGRLSKKQLASSIAERIYNFSSSTKGLPAVNLSRHLLSIQSKADESGCVPTEFPVAQDCCSRRPWKNVRMADPKSKNPNASSKSCVEWCVAWCKDFKH